MLRFFRTIRKKIVEELPASPPGKYIFYAIGEIFLVVIGILLAIQINDWNGQRNTILQEKDTLRALNQETSANLEIINECHAELKIRIDYSSKVRSYLGPEFPEIPIDSINVWLGYTGAAHRCLILTDILFELQSSGNLKIIKDVVLRRQIGRWLSVVEDLDAEEQEWAEEFSREYIPYTNKWILWDDIDYILSEENETGYFPSRFKVDPRKMFQQAEFSNIYAIHFWRMKRVSRRIDSLLVETKLLQQQIESNIYKE